MYIYVKSLFTQNNNSFACGVYKIGEDFQSFVEAWKAKGNVVDATTEQIAEYEAAQIGANRAGSLGETNAPFAAPASNNNFETAGVVNLGKIFIITKIAADQPSRVRVYNSIAARDQDVSRAIGQPHSGDGLIAEIIFTDQINAVNLSPLANGATAETPRASTCPILVQNLSGANNPINIIFSKITLEN